MIDMDKIVEQVKVMSDDKLQTEVSNAKKKKKEALERLEEARQNVNVVEKAVYEAENDPLFLEATREIARRMKMKIVIESSKAAIDPSVGVRFTGKVSLWFDGECKHEEAFNSTEYFRHAGKIYYRGSGRVIIKNKTACDEETWAKMLAGGGFEIPAEMLFVDD